MNIHCYKCKEDRSVSTCGKCRKITKSDLVKILFDNENPIYLHEANRNKKGPHKKHTDTTRRTIAYKHKMGESYRDLAEKYHISSTSVLRYYRQFEDNWR